MFVWTDDRAEETETEDRATGTPPTHEREPPAARLNPPRSSGQVFYSGFMQASHQPFRVRVCANVCVSRHHRHIITTTCCVHPK